MTQNCLPSQNPCCNKAKLPEKCRYRETDTVLAVLISFLSDLVGSYCPAGVRNVTLSSWHIDLDVHPTRRRQTDGQACTHNTSNPIIPFDRFPRGGKSGHQHVSFREINRLRQLLNMIKLPQDSNQVASNAKQWCHHTRWQPLSHECMCSVTSCITESHTFTPGRCPKPVFYYRALHGSPGRVLGWSSDSLQHCRWAQVSFTLLHVYMCINVFFSLSLSSVTAGSDSLYYKLWQLCSNQPWTSWLYFNERIASNECFLFPQTFESVAQNYVQKNILIFNNLCRTKEQMN